MIANCKRCGQLFQKTSREICLNCIKEQHELVRVIKDYLKKHRLATVPEVATDTDIAVEDIVDLIEEKILVLVDYPNMQITCERCGTPTQDGRFCTNCRNDLVAELADMTGAVKSLKNPDPASSRKGYFSK